MAKGKAPCVECRVGDKMPGRQRCIECQQHREPSTTREAWADARLLAVPPDLRIARLPEAKWPPGRRWCAGCQTFVRIRDCNHGASQCKACLGRKAHAASLTRKFTIHGRAFTGEDYDELFERQGGVCYLCGAEPRKKRLAVDHDHRTNEVRGLLCPGEYGCNFAVIGNIEKGKGREAALTMARKIVAYLENPPADQWLY